MWIPFNRSLFGAGWARRRVTALQASPKQFLSDDTDVEPNEPATARDAHCILAEAAIGDDQRVAPRRRS